MHVVLALSAFGALPVRSLNIQQNPSGHGWRDTATEVGRRGEGICPRLTGPANPLVIASERVGVRIIVGTEDSSVVVARIRPGHHRALLGMVNAVFLRG